MKTNTYDACVKMFDRALKVIPTGVYGHLGPAQSCFIPVDAYPLFSERAEGAYFWDLDGNKFIDYMCAYGPIVLGYNDPDVEKAVQAQMLKGNCVTSPSYKIVEMAEKLVDTVAMADWAFFAKNGGDVTSFALMVAKAATGKKKTIMVKGAYHGVAPWTQKMGCPGIVEEDIANNLYVNWNDIHQLTQVIEKHKDEIACFIATPYHHPVFEDNQMPAKGYWQAVRKLCTDNNIILIIDDVRCGFRLDMKGSDHYFGFKADLVCFCKALGNGWNFSALCGINALKEAASEVMYTGSYWMSAVPFAAGIATIEKLTRIDGPAYMEKMGIKLQEGLVAAAKRHGFDLLISGHPSMWYMRITNDDSLMLHQAWVAECVKRGVYFTNHHNLFMNCAMTDEDIAFTLEVAEIAFKSIGGKNGTR